MTRELAAQFIRLMTGVVPNWQGCAPEPRQRIYFANHTSNLDGPAIWSALPRELRAITRPVAATDYWGAGGWRSYAAEQIFQVVLVERRPRETTRLRGWWRCWPRGVR